MFSIFQNIRAFPNFQTCFASAVKKLVRQPASITCLAWSISARHSAICWTLQFSNSIPNIQVGYIESVAQSKLGAGHGQPSHTMDRRQICVRSPIILHIITTSYCILCFRNTEVSAPSTLERLPPKRSSKSVSPNWSVFWLKFRTTLPISESFCPNACRELARPYAGAQ